MSALIVRRVGSGANEPAPSRRLRRDENSWQGRTIANVPNGDKERAAYLLDIVKKRNIAIADQYRERLVALYGQERGSKVRYAEAFQLGQYGRQVPIDELKKMFPTFQ